ncbi:MAG TPA: peptidyl-prolyl cis-trans isomerase [Terriglobales bacterium]|nr:peptidyl-prolyl cis-trans isomerase [Terriglobales bacterium]
MTRHGFLCLLLTAMAWGQAANPKATPATPQTGQNNAAATQSAPGTAAESLEESKVPLDAPVITIKGVCDPSATKSPALECRTEISRAEFENVVEAVQPNLPARARRQFANRYASILAMSIRAKQMGLDKGPDYEERMKLARMQVLANALNKDLQQKASEVTDKEISDYYQANLQKFEQAEMLRIYVPKTPQLPTPEDKKTTGEDKKAVSPEEQQKRAKESEEKMKNEADKLRTRAAAGEDFGKLEEEAFQAAGIKSAAPNTSMGKVRRNVLPSSQASAMDMKPGEVSQVIADQSGFFIYKLVSKEALPLDQARDEIKGTLRSEHLQQEMKSVQEASTPTLNDEYFGPEMPPRGPMTPGAQGPPPAPPKPPGTK